MTRLLQFPMTFQSHLGCNKKGYKSRQWLHSSLVFVGNNCEICLPSSVSALKQRWKMKCHITCEHQPCFLGVVNLTMIKVQSNLAPFTPLCSRRLTRPRLLSAPPIRPLKGAAIKFTLHQEGGWRFRHSWQ